jgi:hypothetical protein
MNLRSALILLLTAATFFLWGYTVGGNTKNPPLKSSYFIWTDEHGTHRMDTTSRRVLIYGDHDQPCENCPVEEL